MKNKHITKILAPIMMSILSMGTFFFACFCLFNINVDFAFAELICCLFLTVIYLPLFILAICDFEISVLSILCIILILATLLAYLYLAWSAYIKPSKTKYGILILLLVIDIVGSFGIFMFSLIIGLINVCFKIAIILCYAKNMRLYDEE